MIITNKHIYRLVTCSDNSRGYRFHKSYIDANVSKDIVENIIYPITILAFLEDETHTLRSKDVVEFINV